MEDRRRLSIKTAYLIFCVLGFMFVFICLAEYKLAQDGNIVWTAGCTAGLFLLSAVAGGFLGAVICTFIYYFLDKRAGKNSRAYEWKLKPAAVFVAAFLLNILAWLPAYLAYYPGICAYDTPIQLGQVMEGYMIDHHPIAHTLLFKAAVTVGLKFFGSMNTGMGIYTFCQMSFLAFGFAYAVYTLRVFNVNFKLTAAAQLCAMFYPFNIYMSVSTTKDTVFTGFFLILMSCFARILLEARDRVKISGTDLVFVVSVAGAILFRNNCLYAMLVLLFFIAAAVIRAVRKKRNVKFYGRLLGCLFVGIAAGYLSLNALFVLTNAQQGDRREMLSMPIQQFARCMIYHGNVGVMDDDDGTLDEESKALINDFLLNEAYKDYVPAFADPVKSSTNTYVARYRSGEFIGTYLKLLAEYPGDFINAALALDAGYLYPQDESHAHINEIEGRSGRGYVQTCWSEDELRDRGLTKASKWEGLHELMERWADENAYLTIPILKYIFVPGTFFWLFVLLAAVLLINRRYRMLLLSAAVFGYYITLFLGPTVQLRYLFPLMTVLPFLAILSFAKGKNFS